MLRNDDELDRLTGELMRKSGTEEPSFNFTESVMQSVKAVQAPVREINILKYLWALPILAITIGGGWYLLTLPAFTDRLLKYYDAGIAVSSNVFTFAVQFIQGVKNFTYSPIILIGFIAALSLLLIDFIYSRKKYQL